MIEIKAPTEFPQRSDAFKIFLAGSIEMGTAENWQTRLSKDLQDFDVVLLNPRRDDWDSSWVQRASNPQFYEQVNWELDMLASSDLIVFYFDPNTKSPITLMELGMFSVMPGEMGPDVIVCCPDGFWRKGNVEIVCDRNNIPLVNTYDEFVQEVKSFLNQVI